jgi:hypothetical protein
MLHLQEGHVHRLNLILPQLDILREQVTVNLSALTRHTGIALQDLVLEMHIHAPVTLCIPAKEEARLATWTATTTCFGM